jgi:xanthine/CO dehydrogenase XdhC/CoxF family maturation factor
MRDILEYVDEWTNEGEQVAVATVVAASGSTPRPVGAKLVVTKSGKMQGSVSGGCVEGAVFQTAMEVMDSGIPQLVSFGISDEMGWEVGLSCGGEIEVFVEPVKQTNASA